MSGAGSGNGLIGGLLGSAQESAQRRCRYDNSVLIRVSFPDGTPATFGIPLLPPWQVIQPTSEVEGYAKPPFATAASFSVLVYACAICGYVELCDADKGS